MGIIWVELGSTRTGVKLLGADTRDDRAALRLAKLEDNDASEAEEKTGSATEGFTVTSSVVTMTLVVEGWTTLPSVSDTGSVATGGSVEEAAGAF